MGRQKTERLPTNAITASHGRWHGFVEVGKRRDGRPDRRHRSAVFCTACQLEPREGCPSCWKTCADKVRKLEDQVTAKTVTRPGLPPTLEQWLSTWLTTIAAHQPSGSRRRPLAPRTLDDYWSKCRQWVFPHVGWIRLDELEVEDLDGLYAAMYRAGKASSHVLKVHAIIRRALAVAVVRDKVTRNVAAQMDNPGSPNRRRPEAYTEDEARRILDVIADRPDRLRWELGLAIGPRQGEALAARWSHLDLDEGTIDTAWQIQRRTWRHGCATACGRKRGAECPARTIDVRAGEVRLSGGLVLCRPKTFDEEVGEHVIAIPPSFIPRLRAHRKAQLEARLLAGSLWEDNDLIFCQENGRPIDPRDDWETWHDIQKAAGLTGKGTHIMRKTAGTLLLEEGEDIAVVQEVLGHADIRTTRGYTRVRTELTRRAAEAMDRGLFGTGSATRPATRRRAAGSRGVDR